MAQVLRNGVVPAPSALPGSVTIGSAATDAILFHGASAAGTQASTVAAVAAATSTASTSTTPFGYATAAQADNIVAQLNATITALNAAVACLKTHGLMA